VNRYLRRALNKRDKGCVVCKAPPWMCHAHHIIYWADGGPTSRQNLVLLCSAHHRAVHAGQWAVSITGGQVHVTRPDWADPPPHTDPAAIAALLAWTTPAQSDAPNQAATSTSDADAGTNATDPTFDPWADSATARTGARAASTATGASTNSASDSVGSNAIRAVARAASSAGWPDISSSPAPGQLDGFPTATRLPSPEVAAAREAFRTRLRALVPDYSDPWATNATPASGP
jgi:hypothetical protein